MDSISRLPFEAWFEEKTGGNLEEMRREAFYSGDPERMRTITHMEEVYRRMYADWLQHLEDWKAYQEHPDINTFVKAYSGHTFGELHDLALATGSYRDYEKLAASYRDQYELLHENPFLANGENGSTDNDDSKRLNGADADASGNGGNYGNTGTEEQDENSDFFREHV